MQLFLQLFVLGCATGGLYALSAMGVVLVYRSSGVINFAAGAIAMVAAYTTYELSDAMGIADDHCYRRCACRGRSDRPAHVRADHPSDQRRIFAHEGHRNARRLHRHPANRASAFRHSTASPALVPPDDVHPRRRGRDRGEQPHPVRLLDRDDSCSVVGVPEHSVRHGNFGSRRKPAVAGSARLARRTNPCSQLDARGHPQRRRRGCACSKLATQPGDVRAAHHPDARKRDSWRTAVLSADA